MAAAASQRVWHDLCLSPAELRISHTLQSGQTFRWKQTGSQEWASVLNGQLIALKETDTTTLFTVLTTPSPLSSDEIAETTSVLTSYFQTHVNLHDCYQRWSALDTNFRAKALCFPGVRILAQDPWENLISFICSANNHIKRITSMVDQLATHFGQYVADHNGHAFYHFPTVSDLNHPTLEAQLRQLGFGYRAKYIHQTVQHLHYKHGQQATRWLQSLRQIPYLEARDELLQLAGIGPKVADCIVSDLVLCVYVGE
ncbi:8-oxoguanine glycosylase ogg1 [Dimargaris xerosporica]|nr:8-oxoguanine glycosylase ogg1 [Dimargaris xerosporica]